MFSFSQNITFQHTGECRLYQYFKEVSLILCACCTIYFEKIQKNYEKPLNIERYLLKRKAAPIGFIHIMWHFPHSCMSLELIIVAPRNAMECDQFYIMHLSMY